MCRATFVEFEAERTILIRYSRIPLLASIGTLLARVRRIMHQDALLPDPVAVVGDHLEVEHRLRLYWERVRPQFGRDAHDTYHS